MTLPIEQVSFLYGVLKSWRDARLSIGELLELQSKRLRALVRSAYDHVPFYRRIFQDAKINPDDIQSASDLRHLPIITKPMLKAVPTREKLANNLSSKALEVHKTSGSTGVPLTVYYRYEDARRLGTIGLRGYFENGLGPLDIHARIIQPYDFARKTFLAHIFFRKHDFSVFDDIETVAGVLADLKPDILEAYASTLWQLVHTLKKIGVHDLCPRIVFSSAEVLDPSTRKLIDSFFGVSTIDTYGSHETWSIAWECNQHAGYHINADSVIVEFIRNGERVAAGERGKIVVTNLFSFAMPLIRYELGDIGIPSNEMCPCGRQLPLMRLIEGKVMDFIVLPSGQLVSPHAIKKAFTMRPQIKTFEVLQKDRYNLRVQIVRDNSYSETIEESLHTELSKVTRNELNIAICYADKIAIPSSGKYKVVESRVTPTF